MSKHAFLSKLETSLTRLPKEERQDIIEDFEEHFQIGLMEGKTEESISASLGPPQQIAKELLASYHIEKMEDTSTAGNVLRATWAVLGLGFFNLVIVLGPFIGLVGVLVAGWVVSVTFIGLPLLVIVNAIIYPSTFEWFEFFLSMVLSGIGIYIAIGMTAVSKFFKHIFVRYLKYNAKLVKGGLKHA